MVAIDFPATPTLGQEFTAAGIRYAWNGYGWLVVPALAGSAEAFVLTSGDTMTGDLIIHKGTPKFTLNKTAAGQIAALMGQMNSIARWQVELGDTTAETGGNLGSNLTVRAYTDTGTALNIPLVINRATGLITVVGDPVTALGVVTKQYVDAKPSLSLATTAEARAGVNNTKAVSPQGHRQSHTPAFQAIAGPMVVSPNTYTAVTSFGEALDTDNRFNGVSFQPNVAGWYDIGGTINMPTSGVDYCSCILWYNAGPSNYGTQISQGTQQTVMLQARGVLFFNGSSDYVELVGLSDHPVGRFNAANFWGFRLFA